MCAFLKLLSVYISLFKSRHLIIKYSYHVIHNWIIRDYNMKLITLCIIAHTILRTNILIQYDLDDRFRATLLLLLFLMVLFQKACRRLVCPPGEYFVECACAEYLSNYKQMFVKLCLQVTPLARFSKQLNQIGGRTIKTFTAKINNVIDLLWGPI